MNLNVTPGIQPIKGSDMNFAREMFAQIAFIRAFEAKAWGLTQVNPPRVMGSMHFCAGQEAVALGALAALNDEDQIISTYRGHGWALASGMDPRSVMAEICQKAEGINGGRAGSPYLMAPDTRFIGENSIVGAGTTIACGVALSNIAKKNGRVVVVSIGDGAMNQGAVHEALAFASAKKLPVIFVVENNGWSELTATAEMFRVERLAQRANGYGMPSATINGADPMVVRDSFAVAVERARAGNGPSLLECRVPRLWGHYNRDIEHYRSKADKAEAETRDPLIQLMKRLELSGMSGEDLERIKSFQEKSVEEMTEAVMLTDDPDPATAGLHVTKLAERQRRKAAKVLEKKELTFIEAVNAALRAELESDERTLVYGEDVGKGGGIFGGSRNLQKDFGDERVFDTPIAENAILGSAVGAAMSGMKPIVEIMWADFIFVAIDQLINQAANIRYITGGKSSVPLVVRMQQGATPGSCAQHSQCIEAMLAHVPGLKVALAATAHDAYALLRAAAADPDPCIVIEARALYQIKSTVEVSDVIEEVGKARKRRSGKDATIVTWGSMVGPSLAAAEALSAAGTDVGVLDLRWLNPLDDDALLEAVKEANGKVLIVHEAVRTGGFAGEVAMRIRELAPELDAKIARLTTPDTRIPSSPALQAALLPNAGTIEQAVKALL